jgi:hypothetical protein
MPPSASERSKLPLSQANLLLLIISLIIVLLSAYNGALRADPEHWGMMLSNALDLADGKTPYSDFIIQYGYLTTILQTLWCKVFGFSYLALGVLTGIFYAGFLIQTYSIIQRLGGRGSAQLFIVLAFILHPFPNYPWADYFAGFFLITALNLLIGSERRNSQRFRDILTGLAFGLSVWCRYTYALPISIFLAAMLLLAVHPAHRILWIGLSFTFTNAAFIAVFILYYQLDVVHVFEIYRTLVNTHFALRTKHGILYRIWTETSVAGIENFFVVIPWILTIPVFVELTLKRTLSRQAISLYVCLAILGGFNLVHAVISFEYYRMINSSAALSILTYWMLGMRWKLYTEQSNSGRPRTLLSLLNMPGTMALPLLFFVATLPKLVWFFPLNTYYTDGHDTIMWRAPSTRLGTLTYESIGRVTFTDAVQAKFYRTIAAEICFTANIFNDTADGLITHLCDTPRTTKMEIFDFFSIALDAKEYARITSKAKLSSNEVAVTLAPLPKSTAVCRTTPVTSPGKIEILGNAATHLATYYISRGC